MALSEETWRQRVEIYAQERVAGKNQSDAFRKSHPHCVQNKWKEKTIWNKAYQFENLDEVQTRIAELSQHHKKRHDINIDRITQEKAHIAYFDPAELFDEAGKLRDIRKLPEHTRRALNITVKGEEITITFNNRHRLVALEKLGNYLLTGSFGTHNVLTGPSGGPIQTQDVTDYELARWMAFELEKARRSDQQEGESRE